MIELKEKEYTTYKLTYVDQYEPSKVSVSLKNQKILNK
jgi:hypothetical protein